MPPVSPVSPVPVYQDSGPWHYLVGNPWADTSDPGYCPGYSMPSGHGAMPTLSWPVPGEINPNRPFSIGHPGLDLMAPDGTPVYSIAPGTVIWSGFSSFGFGYMVAVSHGGGWWSLYGHLENRDLPACGSWVGFVGYTGRTGASNYAHLHLALVNGNQAHEPRLP